MEGSNKRRRLARAAGHAVSDGVHDYEDANSKTGPSIRNTSFTKDHKTIESANVTISTSSKLAGQIVAPFLTKHIPQQYAHLGAMDSFGSPKIKDSSTKYCYRHRPDMKCRKQANEPSMDQLQHVNDYHRPIQLSPADNGNRNSRYSLRPISRLLHMCGLYSQPPLRNNGCSCFKASLHNVAFHNYPTFQRAYVNSSGLISSVPCLRSCHIGSSASWTQPRCARPRK